MRSIRGVPAPVAVATAAAMALASTGPSAMGPGLVTSFSPSYSPPPRLSPSPIGTRRAFPSRISATLEAADAASSSPADEGSDVGPAILSRIAEASPSSAEWGDMFDLRAEAAFHALFSGIRSGTALGLRGRPFHLSQADVLPALGDAAGGSESPFAGYFTSADLENALEEDFLDATRGSTNNAQGWKVTGVSKPRGSSFEDARMTLEDVNDSLKKGTVIFNAIGAHIPKLAGPTLACCDATSLPNALNMYVTGAGKKTSAPPHTDRQDVVVVQTQGRKHWRVYTPPDPALDSLADMYARGKGEDTLALHDLEGRHGCRKLLDVTLNTGDVLFIPAGFPHTTDTTTDAAEGETPDTSVHLTFNLDTHVWDLDYLSARRLALARSGVPDIALGQERESDNRYVGKANLLPAEIRVDLFDALPLGLLDEDGTGEGMIDKSAAELERISRAIEEETAEAVPPPVWRETIGRVRQAGIELVDIHRDMYLAAIEEGRTRRSEKKMTEHLTGEAKERARAMTPEKVQRLSLFRVREYYERIEQSKAALISWSRSGTTMEEGEGGGASSAKNELPDNWEFTSPLSLGDDVEADLGGAFFQAKVTRIAGDRYDVEFFDGDKMDGLDRQSIKLLTPPPVPSSDDGDTFDTTGMTKKEIKKMRRKLEKKKQRG